MVVFKSQTISNKIQLANSLSNTFATVKKMIQWTMLGKARTSFKCLFQQGVSISSYIMVLFIIILSPFELLSQVSVPQLKQDSLTQKPHELDSSKKQEAKDWINTNKDDLSNKLGEKLSKLDSVEAGLQATKISIPDSIFNLKDSISLSKVRSRIKIPSFGHLPDMSMNSRSLIKGTWQSLKSNVNLSGNITSESFVTNYQDPFTVSEKTYSRVYGSPTLQMAGLPLILDFFVTSEPNSVYNSNSFNVRFDSERFKKNIELKAKRKVEDLKKERTAVAKDKLSKEKQREKLDSLLQENRNIIEDITKGLPKKPTIDKEIKVSRPKIDIPEKPELNFSLNKFEIVDTSNWKDSVRNHLLPKFQDTAIYNRYIKLVKQGKNLEQKYQQADSVYLVLQDSDSVLSARLQKAKDAYVNPQKLKQKAETKVKGRLLGKVLNQVDYFEIGINYPYFSEYSLNGTPVKGLNLGLTNGKNTFKLVGGKTFENQFNTFGLDQPKPEFIRNVQGVLFRHQGAKGGIEFSNSSLWDSEKIVEPKRNFVQCVTYDKQFGNKLLVTVKTAYSSYNGNTNQAKNGLEVDKASFFAQRLNQSAGQLEAKYRLDAKSKFKMDGKRIYPGFINLSNPYMRNGYDEYKFNLDRKIFKRKIHTSIFYKHFSDNITRIQRSTNTMKGYGVSIRSSFKKGPNFYLQHAPYEQGNNHPDSIFRTNNQLSVSTAGITFFKQQERRKWSFLSNVTRSQIDFNNGDAPIENVFYNAMVQSISSSNSFSFNGYRNQSKPKVDSLNYMGLRVELSLTLSKKIAISSSFFWDQYDSHDFRYNWINTLKSNLWKSLNIQSSFGIGLIDGLYGLERKSIYSGRLMMVYGF
jgi:hypothetical protein